MLTNIDYAWTACFSAARKHSRMYKLHQVSYDSFVVLDIATETYQPSVNEKSTFTRDLCKNLRDVMFPIFSSGLLKVSGTENLRKLKLE